MKEDIKHKMRNQHQFVINAQNPHLFIHAQHNYTKAPYPLSPANLTIMATTFDVQIMIREKRLRFSGAGSNHFRWNRFAREPAEVNDIDMPSKSEDK